MNSLDNRTLDVFTVKICGITNVRDARIATGAGADAIGLNFFLNSPRCVDQPTAESIIATLPTTVVKVGVFVNAAIDEIRDIADKLGLDAIQLHGDETPEFLSQLGSTAVIRAFRCHAGELVPVGRYIQRCRQLGCLPRAILLDAYQTEQYGGTGKTVDWQSVARSRDMLSGLPLILAGGLTPDNIVTAIKTVDPDAVDTASGVEISPGKKDAMLVQTFISAARSAIRKNER